MSEKSTTPGKQETRIFVGHARLPENVAAYEVFRVLTLELEVDPETQTVVDASCSLVPNLGQRFILDLLIGYNLSQGIEPIVNTIRERYFSITQKAVITSLENAYKLYERYRRGPADP